MSDKARITQVVENYAKAVNTLKQFLSSPVEDDRDRAGIIQAFEFCYELARKSLKKIAEEKGLEAATPLDAFKAGFQMGLIKPEEQVSWLEMKKTRNLTSHTYKEELAAQVLEKIINSYVVAFETVLQRIKNR